MRGPAATPPGGATARRGPFSNDALFAIVVGVCMINGIFSPAVAIALQIAPVLMPEFFPRSVGWSLFFSSILVATATLIFSGVPAALFERLSGANTGPGGSAPMWLWLTVATLLSLPAMDNIQRVM